MTAEAIVAGVPQMVSISTAAKALGISRKTGYRLAAAGEFPVEVRRIGGSLKVSVHQLERYLEGAA